MPFEVFQTEEKRAVDLPAQRIQRAQVQVAGLGLAGLEPLNAVAADSFAHGLPLSPPDGRGGQLAGRVTGTAFRRQLGDQGIGKEGVLLRPALVGEAVNDALQKGALHEWRKGVEMHGVL